MRFLLKGLLSAITVMGIATGVSEALGCNFPLINPPPYTFQYSWQPGPRVLHLSIDDHYNPTDTEQLAHGVLNWNPWGLADCSFVGFTGGENRHFEPEVYAPLYFAPAGNVYIVNTLCTVCSYGSGTLMTLNEDQTRVVGAKIMMNPGVPNIPNIAYFSWASSHEIGHTFGLADPNLLYTLSPGTSVMAGYVNETTSDNPYNHNRSMPTVCDIAVVAGLYCLFCIPTDCPEDYIWSEASCACEPMGDISCTTPGWGGGCPPGTSPNGFGMCCGQAGCENNGYFWNFTNSNCQTTPSTQVQCDTVDWYWNFTNSTCGSSPSIGMCSGGPDWGNYFSTGCYSGLGIFGGSCGRSTTFINKCYQDNGDYDNHHCVCTGCDWCGGSPIVIDVTGNHFNMTDVSRGVQFDLNANGTLDRLSWTAPNSGSAWLVLDRNRNGVINNGKELFGNFTFQSEPPPGVEQNGFRALAEYDKPENGGNADGQIDQNDAVFSHLRLWQDTNQNGISESAEMNAVSEFGIEYISLDYKKSRHRDRYGNEFRYRAKVYGANHRDLGLWAYDVFLLSKQ